jgi:hypothetical protein
MPSRRSLIAVLLLLAFVWNLLSCPASLADTGGELTRPPGPDLADAVLTVDDLPAGFRPAPEQDLEELAPLLQQVRVLLEDLTQAQVQNAALFVFEDADRREVLISLFVSPLNRMSAAAIDRVLSNPDAIIDTFEEQLGDLTTRLSPEAVPGVLALGDRCLALTDVMGAEPDALHLEVVLMRRGPVLSVLWDTRTKDSDTKLDIGGLASIVDERVAKSLYARRSSYRAVDTWVPELSTYIPTPLDVSTDPEVLRANLALAAVATIMLTLVQELVNRTLADHEDDILRILGRWPVFDRWTRGGAQAEPSVRNRGTVFNIERLAVISLIYGLIFSLVDRNWDPFSITGVYLFICLAIASGVVGMSSDLAALRAARRMGLPANLNVLPGNLLLATASAGVSRLVGLVPGVWLGKPEAFQVDSNTLGERRALKLLLAGLRGLVIVAFTVWLLTIATTIGLSALPIFSRAVSAAARLAAGLGGLQSLLLLAFATAVQDIFLEMSGLPDTVGAALRQSNRLLWVLGLLVAVFVYYHTLLNPQGDLAAALQSTSVRLFMITIAGFTVLALGVCLYFRLLYHKPGSTDSAGEA